MDAIRTRIERKAAELEHALVWDDVGSTTARGRCARCGASVRVVAGANCAAVSGALAESPCSAVARATYRSGSQGERRQHADSR